MESTKTTEEKVRFQAPTKDCPVFPNFVFYVGHNNVPRRHTSQVNVTNDHLICIWTGVDFDDVPDNNDLETNPDCTVLSGNHDRVFHFQHTYDGAL